MSRLCLDSGGTTVSFDDVCAVPVPEPSGAHHPVPYAFTLNNVIRSLTERGLAPVSATHALSRDGQQYFGLYKLPGTGLDCPAVGVRASYDKSIAPAIVAGRSVFVCDNLSFTGEIRIARKNTLFARRDLPGKFDRGLSIILGEIDRVGKIQEQWRAHNVSDSTVDTLLMRAVRRRTLPCSKIGAILTEYDSPEHAEYGEGTLWTLFNAVTHTLRGQSAPTIQRRTVALHRMLEDHVAA